MMMACVLCGGSLDRYQRYAFRSKVFRGIYLDDHMYKCHACSLRQVDVSKVDVDKLTRYYVHDYRNVAKIGVDTSGGSSPYYKARASALASLVRATAPRTAFELGSGYGYNLRAISVRFPGIELFTDELDAIAPVSLGAKRRKLEDGPYDIIILSHVLEHFTDPVSVLRTAAGALASGGSLVIEVPNDVEGIYTINGLDEPHLTFFTEPSFRLLMEKAGARVADLFTGGADYREKTFANTTKRMIWAVAPRIPVVRSLFAAREKRGMAQIVATKLYNPRGNVLRAIVTGANRKNPRDLAAAGV